LRRYREAWRDAKRLATAICQAFPLEKNYWIADGPAVRFLGISFPTRMIVVKLNDRSLWVNSPVAATRDQAGQLDAIGPVAHLVSPTPLHDWRLKEWATFFPRAEVWKACTLGDAPPAAWEADIERLLFRASVALSEAAIILTNVSSVKHTPRFLRPRL
jgi:hypothetical protein